MPPVFVFATHQYAQALQLPSYRRHHPTHRPCSSMSRVDVALALRARGVR